MERNSVQGFQLSPQQRSIWLLQAQGGASRAVCGVLVGGSLDTARLRLAVRRVVARHEILRTRFQRVPGLRVPLQVVDGSCLFAWCEVDARALPAPRGEQLLERLFGGEIDAAHDPQADPPLRLSLVRFHDHQCGFLVGLPALCADGATLVHFLDEVVAAYDRRGEATGPGGERVVQYAQFAHWQNRVLAEPEAQAGREFWRDQTAAPGAIPPLAGAELAPGQSPLAPERSPARLSAALLAATEAAAERSGVCLATFLLACWQTVLWRLSRTPVALAVVFSCRVFAELEAALGPFAKALPLVTEVDGSFTFGELLRRLEAQMARADELQLYHAEQDEAPTAPRTPPVVFEYAEWEGRWAADGVSFALWRWSLRAGLCPLKMSCTRTAAGLDLSLDYDPARFQPTAIRRLAGQFLVLLADAALDTRARIGDLQLLDPHQRHQALVEWSGGERCSPEDLCLHQVFERQARLTPHTVALVSGGERVTYGQLDRRANHLAHRLTHLGVGPEVRVGLCCQRSVEMVAGVLGILKSGGVYVPLDPTHPGDYLAHVAEDAGLHLILAQRALREGLLRGISLAMLCLDAERGEQARPPAVAVCGENLAYLIYTSGSTGCPKGVMIRHLSAVHLASSLAQSVYARQTRRLRVSLNAGLGFDASVKQLLQLLGGHELHVVPDELRRDGAVLRSWLRDEGIDVFDCTPSQLGILLQAGRAAGSPHDLSELLLIGGEPIDESTWRELGEIARTSSCNLYGPTETTVDATACSWHQSPDRPTIGRPLPGVVVLLADPDLQPVPIGATGEIVIGGPGLARGYLGRPDLTAERFVPNPWGQQAGERLYRSGDLARQLADGRLEFVGRSDRQVKVRGTRVEPGEVEALLARHPAVHQAVVIVREKEPAVRRLFACVVPRNPRSVALACRPHHSLPNGLVVAHQNLHETEYLYKEIFADRSYLRHGIELCEGDCVFDVGANIGLATLFFHLSCAHLKIYAFEPVPALFEILEFNLQLHGIDAVPLPCGLSDRPGPAILHFYPDYSIMSGLHANPREELETVRTYILNQRRDGGPDDPLLSHLDEFLQGRFERRPVPCRLRSLSEVMCEQRVPRIDLLKIDVQKSELEVLRGIAPEDWPKIRQVVAEVHDFAGRLEQTVGLLRGQGYDLVVGQDELLRGTDRFHVYATRGRRLVERSAAARGARAMPEPLLSLADLRSFAKQKLPVAMQPAGYALVESFPLTLNGKIDLETLALEEARPGSEPISAPRDAVERTLARIWAEVLALHEVGIYDNFFELGGDSILQIQIVAKAREAGLRLAPKHLFQHPTIAALARVAREKAVPPGEEGAGAARPFAPVAPSSPLVDAGMSQEELDELVAKIGAPGKPPP